MGFHCLRRFFSTVRAPPIHVAHTARAGRGVFASRDILDCEVIHTADPVVAHPSVTSLQKVLQRIGFYYLLRATQACYFCLKGMRRAVGSTSSASNSATETNSSLIFCSRKCEDSTQAFYGIEEQADWSQFHSYCSTYGLRFPLVAKRLACMVASSATSPHVLDILTHVNLAHGIPAEWRNERALLFEALNTKAEKPCNLDFLTENWYAGVLSRLHINAFRIERIEEQDTEDLLAAAAASISGESIVGSAVYVLPSMYNHDCDPNVDIVWPNNATASLVACRSIKAGEELRITYIDTSMVRDMRQSFLEENYGFTCNCSRCRDGD